LAGRTQGRRNLSARSQNAPKKGRAKAKGRRGREEGELERIKTIGKGNSDIASMRFPPRLNKSHRRAITGQERVTVPGEEGIYQCGGKAKEIERADASYGRKKWKANSKVGKRDPQPDKKRNGGVCRGLSEKENHMLQTQDSLQVVWRIWRGRKKGKPSELPSKGGLQVSALTLNRPLAVSRVSGPMSGNREGRKLKPIVGR